jgi:hypothetical protein
MNLIILLMTEPLSHSLDGVESLRSQQSLEPVLSQMNPIRTIALHFFKIHFTAVLPSTRGSSKLSLYFSFPPKTKGNKFRGF